MIWLIKRLLKKRTAKRATPEPDPGKSPVPVRSGKSEWERALVVSIEQNCTAPSEDAVEYSFGLYRDQEFTPFLERQHQMAELRTAIGGIASTLNAYVPHLIERVMSSHPFEFSHILEQKELRRW